MHDETLVGDSENICHAFVECRKNKIGNCRNFNADKVLVLGTPLSMRVDGLVEQLLIAKYGLASKPYVLLPHFFEWK